MTSEGWDDICVYREEGMFIAHDQKHDVMVQAPDLPTLRRRLDATMELEGWRDEAPKRIDPG